MTATPHQPIPGPHPSGRMRLAVLVLLFAAAAAVRVSSLGSSTLIAERQFRSAMIARAYYYESVDSIAPWKRHIAEMNRERLGRLEPPILEHVTAAIYRVVGGERLEIPRALSTMFWLLGGALLYRMALGLMPVAGAFAATAYFLFNPLGVHASVSFMPDPLMVGLFIATLLAARRWIDVPTAGRLVAATALAGLTSLIKPLCLFALLGALAALALHARRSGRGRPGRSWLLLAAGVLLPALAYYGLGILIDAPQAPPGEVAAWDTVARQWSVTFDPRLLLKPGFWQGWLVTAARAAGTAALAGGLVGIALAPPAGRALLLGLLAGYAVFCLVFSYHVSFAGYYHLQLLVVVALGIGYLTSALVGVLWGSLRPRYLRALPVAAACLIAASTLHAIHRELTATRIEPARVAREIGELVHHSDRVVQVATFYGAPLQYYGEYYGTWWPSAEDGPAFTRGRKPPLTLEQRMRALPLEPEYFVITDWRRYQRYHADLQEYLRSHCRPVAEQPEFLIYGECRPSQAGTR